MSAGSVQRAFAQSGEVRVRETFGFVPISLGIGCALATVGFTAMMVRQQSLALKDVGIALAFFAGAALFTTWEVWRRRRRLTFEYHGGDVAVYRQGELTDQIAPHRIGIYQLSIVNTIRALFGFGLLGPGALIVGLVMLGDATGAALVVVGFGVGATGAFVSEIYARIFCRHFIVPLHAGAKEETVVLTRADASVLVSDASQVGGGDVASGRLRRS